MYAHYHNIITVNTVAGIYYQFTPLTGLSSFHDDTQNYDKGSDDDYRHPTNSQSCKMSGATYHRL